MNILDNEKCVGCGACINICNRGALTMTRNKDGFYRPHMDGNLCVECGKCVKVCPLNTSCHDTEDKQYYYGWNKDDIIRRRSSSGGAFSAFADAVIKDGGIVFGAAFSDDFKRVVMTSTEKVSIAALRLSKYCGADTSTLYGEMKSALNRGKTVLLCSTPCQNAAARQLLGDNKRLFLVDFCCGGNASAGCFEDYVASLEKKYGAKVCDINFRNKSKSWSTKHLSVAFENGKKYCSHWKYDPYYYGFTNAVIRDEVCLDCPFATWHASDITIGDFWGYEEAGIANDEKGLSLITVHTEKGRELLAAASQQMVLNSMGEKTAAYAFRERHVPESKRALRRAFFDAWDGENFTAAARQTFYRGGRVTTAIGSVFRRIRRRLVR